VSGFSEMKRMHNLARTLVAAACLLPLAEAGAAPRGATRLQARIAQIKAETATLVAAGLAGLKGLSEKERLAAPPAIWQAKGPRLEFKDCAHCPPMVVVPAGEFTMGSPPAEMEAEAQHRVTIAYPFAVGKFAVTFVEWNACVKGGGCEGYQPDDQGWGRRRRPVIDVSWDNAKAYVAWLAAKTGKPYRLLSEAEWEYAARAGTTTRFSVGDAITPAQANFNGGEEGAGASAVNRQKTLPVGSFPPNAFGLYDMQGNADQWVEDCWHDDYTAAAPIDGSAWTAGECGGRVLRGGSWEDSASELRASARTGEFKGESSYADGIRVARGL
jgi:formylglycine-generating enzyme required for sulfatase activity